MVAERRQGQKEGRVARIVQTSAVAACALALLFVASAAVMFLIAELLRAQWLLAAVAAAVLVAVYLLAKRFMRVAANQNKDPLGRRE